MHLNAPDDAFIKTLVSELGQDICGELTQNYLEEPRGRYQGNASYLLKPRALDEVSTIVKHCNAAKVGIVPYGGGTGLVGGQIMQGGMTTILLSLERLNKIRDVDAKDNILVAEAGVILSNVQETAYNVNRLFPLSLASEGSCRIGGVLSTNAGGVNVLRYGNARELCLGIEAVLPDGSIYNGLKRLRKDNTGYDIRNLMIGAEGSLGIITAACLKLYPVPSERVVGFCAVPSPTAALDLLNVLSERLGTTISAFELIHRQGLEFLRETDVEYTEPLGERHEWMVLLDCAAGAGSDIQQMLENSLGEGMEQGLILDAVLAQNTTQQNAFWNIRENIPEGNRRIGSISSHDISVPVSKVPDFIPVANQAIKAIDPTLRINCFGHLGDGNLHYNVFPPKGSDRAEYENIRDQIKTTTHDVVHSFDGSVSAEHGVGRLKKADLLKYSDAGKLAAMRAIKTALDPNGIMNPGAVIDP